MRMLLSICAMAFFLGSPFSAHASALYDAFREACMSPGPQSVAKATERDGWTSADVNDLLPAKRGMSVSPSAIGRRKVAGGETVELVADEFPVPLPPPYPALTHERTCIVYSATADPALLTEVKEWLGSEVSQRGKNTGSSTAFSVIRQGGKFLPAAADQITPETLFNTATIIVMSSSGPTDESGIIYMIPTR